MTPKLTVVPKNIVVLGHHTVFLKSRPLIVGVLNVTPDSFSDGGQFADPGRAVAQFHRLVDEGADLVDIGGESSRPGAEPVDAGEEWRRVGPVLAKVGANSPVPISIDTYKADVARRAIDAGVSVVNDISALRFDAEMPKVVAETGVSVILMHMQGTPRNMQANPEYYDVVAEVRDFLGTQAARAQAAGIVGQKIILDPGIGFGKTLEHNLRLQNQLPQIVKLGYPVLVGVSRKSFIGMISGDEADDRLEGSLAAALMAAVGGAMLVRVHDVGATRRALAVGGAIGHPDRFLDQGQK